MGQCIQHIIVVCVFIVMFGFRGVTAEEQKTGSIAGQMETSDIDPARTVLPIMDIPCLSNAPVIDGIIQSNEWRQANRIEALLIPKTTNIAMPVTQGWLGLDNRNLYLAFRCGLETGVKPKAEAKQHDGDVWKDDSVELYIWPDGSKPVDFQFIVNSIGTRFDTQYTFDINTAKEMGSNLEWNPAWEARTGSEKDAWTLEMAIPWSTLGVDPKGQRGIRFNCYRNAVPGQQRFASWAYLPKEQFHMPDCYGIGICAFDGAIHKGLNPAAIHLGTLGFLRVEQKSPMYPEADNFIALCAVAVPKHPLFESLKIQLSSEVIPMDAAGKPGAPTLLEPWMLEPSKANNLTIQGLGQGNYRLNLHFSGGIAQDQSFVVYNFGKELHNIMTRLEQASLRDLAQKEPFKAAAYLGVAACVEKLKQQMNMPGSGSNEFHTLCETVARLDIIETGKSSLSDSGGLLDLLTLAQNPEAQVVVEYPQYPQMDNAVYSAVTFYWGSIPLVSVHVQEYETKEKAESRLEDTRGPLVWGNTTTVDGHPARSSSQGYEWEPMLMSQFDPEHEVMLVDTKRNIGLVLNTQHLDCVTVESITLLGDRPTPVCSVVEQWAPEKHLPKVNLDDALKKSYVLIAGPIGTAADKLKIKKLFSVTPVNGETSLMVVDGKRLFSVWGAPFRALAEKSIKMVMAGKPIKPKEVDALRLEVVHTLAPKHLPKAIPDGQCLLCGDVHMHTLYSDGTPSPVGLALESLYCDMDFAVITDHNTLEGAQEAQQKFSEHGVSYPIIVGEEITTSWGHLNAYPLKKVIPWTLGSDEIVKLAHEQGAVIQWNHPGFTTSDFEMSHLKTGLVGTGCDAWEHYTWRYEAWRKTDALPVFVGSTDTHSGTFDYPERTIILSSASQIQGDDLADAIRNRRVVMVAPGGTCFLYGSDKMTDYVWSELAKGKGLKDEKAARIRYTLKNADIIGLLKAKSKR